MIISKNFVLCNFWILNVDNISFWDLLSQVNSVQYYKRQENDPIFNILLLNISIIVSNIVFSSLIYLFYNFQTDIT